MVFICVLRLILLMFLFRNYYVTLMRKRFRFFLYCLSLFVFGLFYGFLLYLHGPSGFLTQFAALIYAPALLPIIVLAYLAHRIGNRIIVTMIIILSIIAGYLLGLLSS